MIEISDNYDYVLTHNTSSKRNLATRHIEKDGRIFVTYGNVHIDPYVTDQIKDFRSFDYSADEEFEAMEDAQVAINKWIAAPCVEIEHTCCGCGMTYIQKDDETWSQASSRHDQSDEGFRAHVARGMPLTPSIESMDAVEADMFA